MAIKFNFGGKQIIEPGSYARTINGTTQVPTVASFGKVMIIDTGTNAFWGGGAGINGETASRKNAVYEFDNLTDFKAFVKGGGFWDLADYLFNPSNNGNGIPAIQYVKAATTRAASISYTLTGSGYISKTGTISSLSTSTAVTGSGTKFTTELREGDTITNSSNTTIGVVASITDDLNLVLVANAASTNTNIAFKARYAQSQGGTLVIKPKTEGIGANGFLYNGVLVKGFAAKMATGVLDTNKFRMLFYTGSFRGVNNLDPAFSVATYSATTTYSSTAQVYYDGMIFKSLQSSNLGNNPLTAAAYWELVQYSENYGDSLPGSTSEIVITSSPEFLSLNDLVTWMQTNDSFTSQFVLSSYTVVGDGYVDSADLATYSDFNLATGGTETYASSDLDTVLADIAEEDNTFFLCDKYGSNATGTLNTKILSHIVNDSEFDKFMVVGGGYDSSSFSGSSGSLGMASYFNSSKTMLVHGGVKVPRFNGGTKNLASIYTAAMYLGRTCGLEPQVPTTWKDIKISSPIHDLNKTDREKALLGGVIHLKFVDGKNWVINQSINTLQKNDVLVNPDGNSYEVSIERIKAQLNKELVLNSRVQFIGGNYNTSSAIDLKLFAEGYLTFRTARPGQDNLIVSFQDVNVTLQGDAMRIIYGFVPNGPINKLFFTGILLDANITA